MRKLINDPHFKVTLDLNASSPAPVKSIYTAQHVCVSEGYSPEANIPDNAADIIIREQFKPGHWSVLNFGYVVLHFGGFPHDTVMQLVRHQGSKPLCQSFRYTGDRMERLGKMDSPTLSDIEELFYNQPEGEYPTRNGSYRYTQDNYQEYLERCLDSARVYAKLIDEGIPGELARRDLLSGFRQNFVLAGTIRDVFHWLDQRTLSDTQLEAQTLAWMALDELKLWCPEFFAWYEDNRAGKNKLAP